MNFKLGIMYQIFFLKNYLFSKDKNLYICTHKKKGVLFICGCGVIGSHARLRIWCREAWGFESLHPHFIKFLNFFRNFFCENSSAGRAQPCQGWGRGFESRFSLNFY